MYKKLIRSKYSLFDWPFFCGAGFASALIYCIFTAISFLLFPTSFNFFDNYLSTLGDFYDNPNGALFYDLGMVLCGLASIVFYIGLYKWFTKYMESKLLTISLLFCCINGFAVMMTGIFSETRETFPLHVFWSLVIFFTFFPILLLVNTVFLTKSNINKITVFSGFGVATIDSIFVLSILVNGTGGTSPLLEWLSVFCYIGWSCLLAYSILKNPDLYIDT